MDLKGIFPPLASPCDEQDRFVEEEYARLARYLAAEGVHGFYVCGATGEGVHMRREERKRAVEIAVEVAREKGLTVIAHVGTSNTRDMVELAEHAAEAGADAVSSMAPSNRNFAQLLSYYADLGRAAQLPVIVYHIPVLTGRVMSTDELLQLLDIEGAAGLKWTDFDLFGLNRLLQRRPGAVIFNGYDEMLCLGMMYGACGGIGTHYNLFPRLFGGIYEAARSGDLARAVELQQLYLNFADVTWNYGIVLPFELLMREKGLLQRCWRRPRQSWDAETERRFREQIAPSLEAIEQATGA